MDALEVQVTVGRGEAVGVRAAQRDDEVVTPPLLLGGVSLGGNVLLKWLGEQGSAVPSAVRAAVAVSVPFDLMAGADKLDRS